MALLFSRGYLRSDFRRLFEGGRLEIPNIVANPAIEKLVLAMRRDLGMRSTPTVGSIYYSTFREDEDLDVNKPFETG